MRDSLDKKILELLQENGRMTVKEIAKTISLTAPAVSERIKKLEKDGLIEGYTAIINPEKVGKTIHALISVSVTPKDREEFIALIEAEEAVALCHHVTGPYSYIVRVDAKAMPELERLITKFQKMGETNTQIILSSPIERKMMF